MKERGRTRRNPLCHLIWIFVHAASVWHLFKINLRNYHSGRAPSLGFYNFIFFLQCLYPRAPRFISAAQPWWIIKHGSEQEDDEWHECSLIQTAAHLQWWRRPALNSLPLLLLLSHLTFLWHTMSCTHKLTCKHKFSNACKESKYAQRTHSRIHLIVCRHPLVYCQFPLPLLYAFKAFELKGERAQGCLGAAPHSLRSLRDTASWQASQSKRLHGDMLARRRRIMSSTLSFQRCRAP